MIAVYLWIAGSLVMLLLGSIHLLYTFFSGKFLPATPALYHQMRDTPMLLTKRTTIWKAWVGFNASHSIGVMYFGLINIFLVAGYFDLLQASHFFYSLNIGVVAFYLWLARRYWFRVPFMGVAITLACYVTAALVTLLKA